MAKGNQKKLAMTKRKKRAGRDALLTPRQKAAQAGRKKRRMHTKKK